MKTLIFYFAILVWLIPLPASAQVTELCGLPAARQKLIKEHPEVLQKEAELESFTKNFIAHYGSSRDGMGNIVIPIVFHIIHQGGPENISDAQIINEVNILNRDYNKQNADTSAVVPSFVNIVASVGVHFRLATIDPNGNCTNGIDRIYSDQTFEGNDYSKLNGWPREKYLNVWVVSKMMNGVAGYAYYPGSVSTLLNAPNMDGVIILSGYIGSIGSSDSLTSRALTHEIGHYLNLKHPWGDNNSPGVACGDDDVDDTPITRGSTFCDLTLSYCNPPIIENVQNYMDYSYCSVMFTEGQKARMLAALASDVSGRNNLYSDANLIATGTVDNTPSACAPKADFGVVKRYACIGTNVTFINASNNGTVDQFYWSFPNGNPSSSTDPNPTVQFTTTGYQSVSLTVSNSMGSSTKTDNALVYVGSDQPSYQAPFFEGFEDPNVFSTDWAEINYDENVTQFKQVNIGSHTGNGSAELNNYNSIADHDIDEIVSPGIDLTALSNDQMQLSFYYSLASFNQYFTDLQDSLVVYSTTNCGVTWNPIYMTGGTTAVNAGYVQPYFVPTQSPSYWKHVVINLDTRNARPSNVRYKFQVFSAVNGNNFYIDDINIGNSVTGIKEASAVG
ncbi:MAG: hypothetical protein JWO06_3592, partial [Bacteroidota bacterium]|nr:hypothetical protein [Bacteroidota bacterium]